MFLQNAAGKMRKIYHEYPRIFWIVIAITFIDRIGGALLFPFFALYITSKFNVGMTDVGVLFAAFSVSSFVGQTVGGALTDRFGRKGIIIFGLIASSFSTVAMVVFMQFPITRRITKYPPMLMMAFGTFLYVIGFSMYGFVSTFALFVVAMMVITVGEMVVSPVSQALVASFAPEDMRGRYMAVSGFSWMLPFAMGPYLAGLILDGPKPYLLWYAAGFIGMLSTFAFLALYRVRHNHQVELQTMPEAAALGN